MTSTDEHSMRAIDLPAPGSGATGPIAVAAALHLAVTQGDAPDVDRAAGLVVPEDAVLFDWAHLRGLLGGCTTVTACRPNVTAVDPDYVPTVHVMYLGGDDRYVAAGDRHVVATAIAELTYRSDLGDWRIARIYQGDAPPRVWSLSR